MGINRPEIKYIGRKITYQSLKNAILDNQLDKGDTIILNTYDLDKVILEYFDFYNQSMTFPHLLLGILIREADGERIPRSRIGILRNVYEYIDCSEYSDF